MEAKTKQATVQSNLDKAIAELVQVELAILVLKKEIAALQAK